MSDPFASVDSTTETPPVSLPNPFAALACFEDFRNAVEPLAAEFLAKRQALREALLTIADGPGKNWEEWAGRLMAVGNELNRAGLNEFLVEMAIATPTDKIPTAVQTATQTVWCLLSNSANGDKQEVVKLLSNSRRYMMVHNALSIEISYIINLCLTKWGCVSTFRFVDRLQAQLHHSALTAQDAMTWTEEEASNLPTDVLRTLRSWLWSISNGQPIALLFDGEPLAPAPSWLSDWTLVNSPSVHQPPKAADSITPPAKPSVSGDTPPPPALLRGQEGDSPPTGPKQAEGSNPPGDPPDKFAELLTFARDNLKGQERAVIEALCASNGELPIPDLAVKNGVNWEDAFKGFKNAQDRLNPKLKATGWKLTRLENKAKLTPMKA
jgi:hypothetical protein